VVRRSNTLSQTCTPSSYKSRGVVMRYASTIVTFILVASTVFPFRVQAEDKPAIDAVQAEIEREAEWEQIKKIPFKTVLAAYSSVHDLLGPEDILVGPLTLYNAEAGDHFETINLDRPGTQSAFGNPDSRIFHSTSGNDSIVFGEGTFGSKVGGGRKLMVPDRSAELSMAIYRCLAFGLDKKLEAAPTDAQKVELSKLIKELGAENFAARENASKEILKIGVAALAAIIEARKESRDQEVLTRLDDLDLKIKLNAVVKKFQQDNPIKPK
jgi:hypothetical protein